MAKQNPVIQIVFFLYIALFPFSSQDVQQHCEISNGPLHS